MNARLLLSGIMLFFYLQSTSQNHVAASMEWVNTGTVSFSSTGSQPWTTYRSSTPGYFSATQGAVYTSASDLLHVDGYVKKYGNEAFTFPVGSGTNLRTLSIRAPASASDAYAAAWMDGRRSKYRKRPNNPQ